MTLYKNNGYLTLTQLFFNQPLYNSRVVVEIWKTT